MRTTLFVIGLLAASSGLPAYAQTSRPQPSERVQMPRTGAVSFIGVRLGDVAADQVKSLKLPKAEGAVVESVNPNSPASAAGLREKDVIVEFDGEHVRSARHLTRLVSETPVGREVELSVIRDGRKTEMHIKPEAGPWFSPEFGRMIDQDRVREFGEEIGRQAREMSRGIPERVDAARRGMAPHARLGVSVQSLTPELAGYFGVKSGVLVASVEKGSAADKAGVKVGDIITEVDGHDVSSPAELLRALPSGNDKPDKDVKLSLTREKKELTLNAVLR